MKNKVINLSDNSFDTDVLKAKGLILVDFWAEWCNPCKSIAPILDDISNEYQGRLVVTKLNVDQNPRTTSKYGVRSIPMLLLFNNGEILANRVGLFTKSQLKEFIDPHI